MSILFWKYSNLQFSVNKSVGGENIRTFILISYHSSPSYKMQIIEIVVRYTFHGFTQFRMVQQKKTLHFNIKSMATLSVALAYMLATHSSKQFQVMIVETLTLGMVALSEWCLTIWFSIFSNIGNQYDNLFWNMLRWTVGKFDDLINPRLGNLKQHLRISNWYNRIANGDEFSHFLTLQMGSQVMRHSSQKFQR